MKYLALVALAGCVSYSGGGRAVDPARLTAESGWIVTGPVQALRQRDRRDCGAAALAMIASRWGIPLSLDAAAVALPAPTSKGIQLGAMRDTARARGLTAFAIAGDRDTLVHELRAGRPVIVGLHLPYGRRRLSHYEVVVARHPASDQFVTLDPASGWRTRSWTDLDAEWQPAGRPALIVLGRR